MKNLTFPVNRAMILVVPLAAIHTVVAVLGAPHWDDGLIRLLALDGGPSAVFDAHSEVPLYAMTMSSLISLGAFWHVSALVHFFAWLGVGVLSVYVLREIAPSHSASEGLMVAVIASTGMIGQYFCHLSTIWGTLASPQLVWIAFFLARSMAKGLRGRVVDLSLVVLVGVAFLFSLYALPAFLAACAVFLFRSDRPVSRPRVAILMASGILGLALSFLLIGEGGNRESISLVSLTKGLLGQFLSLPERGLDALWQVSTGLLLDRVNEVRLIGARKAVLFGAGLVCLWIAARRASGSTLAGELSGAAPTARPKTGRTGDIDRIRPQRELRIARAAVALCLGLLPILLSGRPLGLGVFSRYWLPLIPIATATFAMLLLYFVTTKARPLICGVMVFVSGYTFELAMERFLDRDQLFDVAAQVASENLVIDPEQPAVVVLHVWPTPWPYYHPDFFELTARFNSVLGSKPNDLVVFATVTPASRTHRLEDPFVRSHRGHTFFDHSNPKVLSLRQDGPASWSVVPSP